MDVKLVVTDGSKQSKVVKLRSEETIIGRQKGCDLRIPSAQVSRRHCRLSFRDDCLIVEDLASANGSYLNGVAVEGQELVRPGDELKIGPITFRVEYRLTTTAIKRLMESGFSAQSDGPETVPLSENEPPKGKKKKGAKTAAPDADGDIPTINFDDLGWQPPQGEDVRDILSHMEDE
jgi:pSer/pThr/pTyr-binding forkhead associated (FHA) protein